MNKAEMSASSQPRINYGEGVALPIHDSTIFRHRLRMENGISADDPAAAFLPADVIKALDKSGTISSTDLAAVKELAKRVGGVDKLIAIANTLK